MGQSRSSSQGFVIKKENITSGSNVIYRRQNEIPFPTHLLSAVNDNQATLLRTSGVCFEAIDWLDQFCPLLTNFKHAHIVPADAAEPIKRHNQYSSFQFRQRFPSLQHAFVCLFSILSFGLFTATFPKITVDKFNVPELGVHTQEGFWSTTVDAYHHGYQLTGNDIKKTTTIKQHHIQPKRHQDVWTDVYQGWLASASHILVLAFLLRGDLGAW